MPLEERWKPESRMVALQKPKDCTILLLRVVAFMATLSATLVMALNKETKTLVLATVGTTQYKTTVNAKFQQNPANVYFVVANAIASLHNLSMIIVHLCEGRLNVDKGLRLVVTAILDMMIVSLVSSGGGAATFMAQLGKNGNSNARWDKVCDKVGKFCDHGAGALIASYVGLLLLVVISVLSIIKLLKTK